jgi:hypothetical protein
MSRNINVNPGNYKVAGRERQGEDVLQTVERQAFAEQRAAEARWHGGPQADLPGWETPQQPLAEPRDTFQGSRVPRAQGSRVRKVKGSKVRKAQGARRKTTGKKRTRSAAARRQTRRTRTAAAIARQRSRARARARTTKRAAARKRTTKAARGGRKRTKMSGRRSG